MTLQKKPNIITIIAQIIKLFVVIIALIIAYLFALNGRYTKIYDDSAFFDKWTKKIIGFDEETGSYN